jgi:hypothetical protein
MARFKIKDKTKIAKVGTWNGHDITELMLKEIVNNSDAKIPITRGHVKIQDGDIAKGNISALHYEDGALYAERTLYDDLAEDWEEERFINQSVEMNKYNGKWAISALALLGAEPPGMKGLAFCEEIKENVIRFTEKLNEEVIMPENNEFQKGYEAGLLAKENELTLKFSEEKEQASKDLELKFNEAIEKKNEEIAELKKNIEDQKKLQFNEKIEEVVKTVPEKDREEVKAELIKFSEKLEYDMFAVLADKYKVEEIKVPEVRQFKETEKSEEIKNEFDKDCPAL